MHAYSDSINLLQADLKHRMSVFAQTDNSPEGQVQSQRQHLLTTSQLWRLLEGQLVSIAGHWPLACQMYPMRLGLVP